MEKREISQEVYEKIRKDIPEAIIQMLPDRPENLRKYAKRVKEVQFSKGIPDEVKQKMIAHRLSDEEYLKTYFRIAADVFAGRYPEQEGKAYVLLAQTGAGKTKLREKTLRQDTNTVVINSDEYKKFRADAEQIRREDPVHFGALTGIDCYDHARNIVTFAVENAYNLSLIHISEPTRP